MTQQPVNKDLLIDILTKQNDNLQKLNETLKQLNKAQQEQLSSFRERIQMFEVLVQKMVMQEELQDKLLNEQTERVKILQQKNQLLENVKSIQEKYIIELGGEVPTVD